MPMLKQTLLRRREQEIIMAINTLDPLTGAIPVTPDPLSGATKLKFKEVAIDSTYQFIGTGEPGRPQVGSGLSYTADLFDSNNVLVGTNDVNFVFTKQLENGDVIGSINETLRLPGGEIFTLGTFNRNKLAEQIPQKVYIIGGTGIYDHAYGKETITLPNTDALNVVNLDLKIV